jgi:signal transduction histidine kinase
MATLIQQVFSILVAPPGNLVYHLVLVFSIAGSLQLTLMHWQSGQKGQAKRTLTGLAILLGMQFVLFIFSGLGWQGLASPDLFLPPVDRAVTVVCLIWIIWMWGFPEPVRWADTLAIILSVLALVALGLTLSAWQPNSATGDFNALWLDKSWQAVALALALLGAAILLMRRPAGWGYGIGFMSLVLVGHLTQILFPQMKGNFPGAVRLVQLAAYPLLLLLPQRLASIKVSAPISSASAAPAASRPLSQERRRYSADPKTVHSFIGLALEDDPLKACTAITRSVSQAMLADLCFLMSASDDKGMVIIEGGYDLIREDKLDGCTLEKDKIPLISNAILRGRGLRLPANHTSSIDMKTLGSLFSLANPGNLLAVPLLGPNQTALGGVLLLSPYSNRVWSADDQAYLTNISDGISRILQRFRHPAGAEPKPEGGQAELQNASATIEQLQNAISSLSAENAQLRAATATAGSSAGLANPLGNPNEEEIQFLENELRLALKEVAHLQNALAEANMLILQIEKEPASSPDLLTHQLEAVHLALKELRHSTLIITGQAENLSKESLDPAKPWLQKSLERIKNEGGSILGLIDGIVQTTMTKSSQPEPAQALVNVEAIIDHAISLTAARMREKNITLRVDLPDHLPQVPADREALQQVVIYLLQNASAVTPPEETVRLKISERGDNTSRPPILIQVTDKGGGISDPDINRLFSGADFASLQPIKGVGHPDELAVARALAEAQGGKLWVECDPGRSSTFTLMLPFESAPAHLEKISGQA